MLSKQASKHRARPELNESQATELADLFRLMSDATRLRIVLACIEESVCVSDIAERLGLPASLVSHHLRLLRAARILSGRRQGRQVFYSVLDDHVRCVLYDMVDHVLEPPDAFEGD